MNRYFPLLAAGGIIGALSIVFVAVYIVFIGKKRVFRDGDRTMKDGEILQVGDICVSVMHTPGHTSGGISFMIENNLFSSIRMNVLEK